MAYYPIKCPYCLKTHTNDTVLFNLRDAVTISSRELRFDEISEDEQDAKDFSGNFSEDSEWEDALGEDAGESASSKGRRRQIPTSGFFTLQELRLLFGEENVEAEYKQVNALPALTDSSRYEGDLLNGVTLKYREDGVEITKRIGDRYCDCGDGDRKKRLNTSSGSVASYVVLLMGSSDSGKTMYLVSLYRALTQRGGYPLPPGESPVARLSMDALSEGEEDTSIGKLGDDMFENGVLPPTTIAMTNEPLAIDITVSFPQSGVKKKALLFLRDMPGEYLTNRERDQEIQKIATQFPKFDGFMIMFDPLTFSENVFPVGKNGEDQRRQVQRLRDVIKNRVTPMMEGNIIKQPTAALITKGDKFFDRRYIGALRTKKITPSNPVLAIQQESYDRPYFEEVNSGARQILGNLSPNVLELIDSNFDDAFFSLASALCRAPIEVDENARTVATPTAINPWRVIDPMLRLLMKLNIAPPFEQTIVRKPVGESADDRKARIYTNRAIFNDWGQRYCTGWKDIT